MKTLKCISVSVLYDGVVVVDHQRTISLKELKTYQKIVSTVSVEASVPVTLPNLVECKNIIVKEGSLNLPKLNYADHLEVYRRGILYVPKLAECDRINLYANVGLPALKKCGYFHLSIWTENNLMTRIDLQKLSSLDVLDVSGCAIDLIKIKSVNTIRMWSNSDINLPNLTKVKSIETHSKSCSISVPKVKFVDAIRTGSKVFFDNLEACGQLSICPNSKFDSPKLKYVGRLSIDCSPKINVPKLKFIGFYSGDLNKLKSLGKIMMGKIELLEELGSKYVWADGILSSYEMKITKLGVTFYMGSDSCVVTNGEFNAHDSNYIRALKSLKFKTKHAIENANVLLSKEKIEVLPGLIIGDIKPETEFTLEEAVTVYRNLTGACKYGCEAFVRNLPEEIRIKEKFTYAEMKELTVGHYGHEDLV